MTLTKAPDCVDGRKRHAWGLINGRRIGDIYSGIYVESRTCTRCNLRREKVRGQITFRTGIS